MGSSWRSIGTAISTSRCRWMASGTRSKLSLRLPFWVSQMAPIFTGKALSPRSRDSSFRTCVGRIFSALGVGVLGHKFLLWLRAEPFQPVLRSGHAASSGKVRKNRTLRPAFFLIFSARCGPLLHRLLGGRLTAHRSMAGTHRLPARQGYAGNECRHGPTMPRSVRDCNGQADKAIWRRGFLPPLP